MNKQEVSQRVLQNGKPLSLDKFEWNEKTRTFSSEENGLVIDFRDVDGCTFKTGSGCTFNTGSGCTFDTGWNCMFNTGSYCMFKTGWGCTFNTNWSCTFSIWKTGYINNNAEDNVVIVRDSVAKTVYDLDTLPKQFLQLTINNVIAKDYKEVELVDDSLMVKLSSNHTKDNITFYLAQYVIDYFENIDKKVYIAQDSEYFAHGYTLESAIKNVIFKKQYDLGAEENAKRVVASGKVTMEDYRLLTGSCDTGTKHHLDKYNIPYDTVWTIDETIDFIKKTSAYRADIFIENLKKVGWKNERN